MAPGLIKRLKTDRVDRRDKRGRAAVHDRRLGTIDFNDGVVDAESRERGQYVLGGGYQRPGGVAQHGGEFGGGDRAHVGRDLTILPAVDMGADETQPGVGVGRMQRQRDRQTGMDADTAQRRVIAKRRLLGDFHSPVPATPAAVRVNGTRQPQLDGRRRSHSCHR